MQQLYLINFLKTVLILYIIYKVVQFGIRYYIKKKVAEQQAAQRNSVDENQAENMRANQGRVNVRMGGSKKAKKTNSDQGEFIDYEEVD